MNRLIKNMSRKGWHGSFAVTAIVLLISLAAAAMGHTSVGIYADPNEPGILPEMTPGGIDARPCVCTNVIAEDPNEPGNIPEMVPNGRDTRPCVCTNVISQDPNEEPAEMVPNI